nr:MAG TPA: hypothetical protein [Caudoviricetes sp.]
MSNHIHRLVPCNLLKLKLDYTEYVKHTSGFTCSLREQ